MAGFAYPVFLSLEGRLTVVVGAGRVATRKVRSLLEAGARVQVIAPAVTEELREMAKQALLTWECREYREGDLEGAFLAVAATDHREVNRRVGEEAHRRGILVNVIDRPQEGNFIVPAVARQGSLVASFSTGGRSPVLSAWLRRRLEGLLEEAEPWADLLEELRAQVRIRLPDPDRRTIFWREVLEDPKIGPEGGNLREVVEQIRQTLREAATGQHD